MFEKSKLDIYEITLDDVITTSPGSDFTGEEEEIEL